MEQIIVVDSDGRFKGTCPKCKKWCALEYAHNNYAGEKYTKSSGMYLCHVCNLGEKKVNPTKTRRERALIASRDYRRKNLTSVSHKFGNGERIRIQFNIKTGAVTVTKRAKEEVVWVGNIGTDLPEILYVVDGEIEEG